MSHNVKKCFERFSNSSRFKTVAEHLNAEGHRSANGAMFTGQSVARILRDKTHLDNGTISQELWDEVQTILAARERGSGAKRRVAHLCAGLLHCGCGQAMYVPTNSKKYTCQKCRNKISKDDLEIIVLENLRAAGDEKIRAAVRDWENHSFEKKREIVESTVEGIIAEDKRVLLTLFIFR